MIQIKSLSPFVLSMSHMGSSVLQRISLEDTELHIHIDTDKSP